jgi:hypothetical protein
VVSCNRQLSTAYVKSLESEADDIQFKLDHGIIPSVDPDSDPRPKLKVLRIILNKPRSEIIDIVNARVRRNAHVAMKFLPFTT